MPMRMTADNVLIRFVPPPKKTSGGILFMPDTAKPEQTMRAEVMAVGPGHYERRGFGGLIPTTLKVGEIVLVDRQAGQDYRLDVNIPRHNKDTDWADAAGNFRIVREEEVLAVVEED